MKDRIIRLTIESVHVFRNKKMAIKIPAGEILIRESELNLDTMWRLFTKSLSFTLPLDKLMEIENKIKAFRVVFNKREDVAFATISNIQEDKTNRPIMKCIKEYRDLDKRLIDLKDKGYEICGIYYAISVLMKEKNLIS
ncbi:hypothetical protein HMPREF1092_02135 [Clostridium thermobutyricum]|uniref:Uncharacterized protein n=1 Tax=Clostridium thermobutyricum TaxID=29372 RepID=N9WD57_9CLOT|nr:hypothetical protein [Clostridium thermobutyricum]ENZ00971.1 hypothetical protein HMPREF1092_02135 [Clostridium thermobutyricum]